MSRTLLLSDLCTGSPELSALSDKAFRLWVSALTWSMGQNTEGIARLSVARYFVGRSAKRCVAELVAEGLWIPLGDDRYEMLRAPRGLELWRPGPTDGIRRAIPEALRQAVYERDGRKCLACGATERLTLDHIVHFSAGGDDTYDNLRTLCGPCNSSRRTRTDAEWGRI